MIQYSDSIRGRSQSLLTSAATIQRGSKANAGAFTLIELILVMALLAVVMALAAPSLANFFRGRKLDSEARRFLSLTRYAQNWAVSEGVPMVLWIDQAEGRFGLRELVGFSLQNLKPGTVKSGLTLREGEPFFVEKKILEFQLPESLHFQLETTERLPKQIETIHFSPDGAIGEGSVPSLYIIQDEPNSRRSRDSRESSVWITQSRTRLNYEIQDKTNTWARINL
jgi:type II secretion system protein H